MIEFCIAERLALSIVIPLIVLVSSTPINTTPPEALANAHTQPDQPNPFFYVSSSEWNLYRFIAKFTRIHKLPKAVFLLKDIKRGITDFFMSGRGNHDHKFEKIKHILEFYPGLQYVLLGDDSQQDPLLYKEETLQRLRNVMFRTNVALKKAANIKDNRSKVY